MHISFCQIELEGFAGSVDCTDPPDIENIVRIGFPLALDKTPGSEGRPWFRGQLREEPKPHCG